MNLGGRNSGLDRVSFSLKSTGVPLENTNRLRSGIHSRGFLPHVKREGASYFVTFRLADSLPRQVLERYRYEYAEAVRLMPKEMASEQSDRLNRELRRKIERYLDRGVGECFLRCPEIAEVVAEALRHFDGLRIVWTNGW